MEIKLFDSGRKKLSEKLGISSERADALMNGVHTAFEELIPEGQCVVFEVSILLQKAAREAQDDQELVFVTHIATLGLIEYGTRLS